MGEEEPTQTPHDLAYSNDHLWVRRDGGEALLGVTAFACDQLGEIVYVELPEAATVLHQDEPFGVIESVKSVSDLFAPVSGLVVERNDAAVGAPEVVGQSPYGEGWLLRVSVADEGEMDSLMDATTYRETFLGD